MPDALGEWKRQPKAVAQVVEVFSDDFWTGQWRRCGDGQAGPA